MRIVQALVGVIVAASLALSSVAAATPRDAAASTAFVAAAIRVEGQAVALFPRGKAAASALIRHLLLTCPGAVPASLRTGTRAQGRVLQAFLSASGGELALAEVSPIEPAEKVAIEAISHLRWSDASVNRAVTRYVRQARATFSLRSPDLCAETNAAKASGFSIIPSRITKFLRSLRPAVGGVSSLSALVNRMTPYLRPSERGNVRHLRALEKQLDTLLARFSLGAYPRMISALFG